MIFGTKHLIGLAMMFGLVIIFFILAHFFIKGEKAKGRTLKCISLFLLFLEFLKFVLVLRGDGVTAGAITVHVFPFHLCSMPLFLFPMVAFGKNKFVEFLKPAAFVVGIMAATIALAYPSNILYPDIGWFHNFGYNLGMLSFIYHTTMIVFAVYMLLSKNYKPKIGDIWKSLVVIAALALMAITLNQIIPGADYFMLQKGSGNPLSFIINSAGQWVFILTIFALAVVVICLIYLPVIILHFRKKRKR